MEPTQWLCDLVLSKASVGRALQEALTEKAEPVFQVRLFHVGTDAFAAWAARKPDLVLWDSRITPPVQDLPAAWPRIIVWGDSLADLPMMGRIERPARLGKIVTRLRQAVTENETTIPLGAGQLNPQARQILWPTGDATRLTDKETGLLVYLWRETDFTPRDVLLSDIWGYNAAIDTHTLETHIYNLRQKLGPHGPGDQDPFETNEGGYRLNPIWRL